VFLSWFANGAELTNFVIALTGLVGAATAFLKAVQAHNGVQRLENGIAPPSPPNRLPPAS
jgi:hypothetical protein